MRKYGCVALIMIFTFVFVVAFDNSADAKQRYKYNPSYLSVADETVVSNMIYPSWSKYSARRTDKQWITGAMSSELGLKNLKVYVDGKRMKVFPYIGRTGEKNLNGKWAVLAPEHNKKGYYNVRVVAQPKYSRKPVTISERVYGFPYNLPEYEY